MKKIAIVLILILVPVAAMGFFFGQNDMLGFAPSPTGGSSGDALLLESGDYLLLESGDYLLIE